MKKRILQTLAGIVVVSAVIAAFTIGKPKREVKAVEDTRAEVKIAYLPTTHSLALLAQAELMNKSSNYRITLVKYGTWPDLSDALNTGQVDGAVELTELSMKANENGIPIKAVALGHRDGNVIVTDKKIKTAKDLKGKSFAIPSKLSSHNLLLEQMLAKNGLSRKDINIIELSPSEMPFALVSKQIAGYCVAEPFGGKAIRADVAKVLYESNDLWEDSICCALVFHKNFLDGNKELADEVIMDYIDAGAYLDEHPEEALTIGENYLSVDKEVLEVSMKWISFSNLEITEKAYEGLCSRLKEYDIMSNPPSYTQFVLENDAWFKGVA